jgi:hypothetical protein
MRPKPSKVKLTGRGELPRPKPARPKPGPGDARTIEGANARAQEKGFAYKLPRSAVYVFTAAQNAAPVHTGFLGALETYVRERKGSLHVVPFRYRNATSFVSKNQKNDDWWAPELAKYLYAGREFINDNLSIIADLKTQPTRQNPLSGLDALSTDASGIFPHPKIELKTVPTPGHKLPKILVTTGAVTQHDLTDSAAGKIAEFHHSLAALVVETDGKLFWLRHVYGDRETGEFTDLETIYSANGTRPAPPPLAVILGDQHVQFHDPAVDKATQDIVRMLKPEFRVYHDLLDSYAANPHHNDNPFITLAKHMSGFNSVHGEVVKTCDFVNERSIPETEDVVVSSNHDDFFRRWIIKTDWRSDPTNAELYLQTALEMVRGTRMGPGGTEYPSPFDLWAKKLMPKVRMLRGDESFQLAGVELGMHGDRGPNGARGSIKNLRRIGHKIVIGHSHSPGISEGAFQVGTSSRLKLEYNSGPSGWAHAHCILYASGKRALIFVIDGRWRA